MRKWGVGRTTMRLDISYSISAISSLHRARCDTNVAFQNPLVVSSSGANERKLCPTVTILILSGGSAFCSCAPFSSQLHHPVDLAAPSVQNPHVHTARQYHNGRRSPHVNRLPSWKGERARERGLTRQPSNRSTIQPIKGIKHLLPKRETHPVDHFNYSRRLFCRNVWESVTIGVEERNSRTPSPPLLGAQMKRRICM